MMYLNKITKTAAVQMKDQTFSRPDAVSIVAFLKDLKAAYNA